MMRILFRIAWLFCYLIFDTVLLCMLNILLANKSPQFEKLMRIMECGKARV